MKPCFPKNKYQLYSSVEPKSTSEKDYTNKIIMMKNRVMKNRKKKGYGFKKYKI